MRRTEFVRLDPETKKTVQQLARELAFLENRKVPEGEIVSRVIKNEEIKQRLRIGSKQRRLR